ncbi:hypothetical protein CONLIGDRAFT_574907 [Coniochaeta ligniaria NRRL 30616]|uniref:HD domain-containing protein n=1 Tax=Coniochaeta ligniaria NRRL 30616 TaxID=1408157 RepID=A0A1J7ITD1_9PEZI|nr:hypothetical protein CONLIGDRAFT_574907 [Coniochaeta ligniaria NRRL 30616]
MPQCHDGDESSAAEMVEVGQQIMDLIPDHPACKEALGVVRASLPASVVNHCLRVFLYAHAFSERKEDKPEEVSPIAAMPVKAHVLFVACIYHDLGVAAAFDEAGERFEVSGADAAARLLRRYGEDEASIREAWLAISVHSSHGIANRMGGMVRALWWAVGVDFGAFPVPDLGVLGAELASSSGWDVVEKELPRLGVAKDLGDAVVRQCLHRPEKAPPNSWSALMLRAKKEEPDWDGVNKAFGAYD